MWKGIKEFNTYNKKQRNGLLALMLVIILLQFFLHFRLFVRTESSEDFTEFEHLVKAWRTEDSIARYVRPVQVELTTFDPNSISGQKMMELGFTERLAQRLVNYREKGGSFTQPSDLLKIYGMSDTLYQALLPYIHIKEGQHRGHNLTPATAFSKFDPNEITVDELEGMGFKNWQAKRVVKYRDQVKPFESPEELYKIYGLDSSFVKFIIPYVQIDSTTIAEIPNRDLKIIHIELNTADSLQLLEVDGIGPFYCHKILEYRRQLGGFSHVKQLLEVYGLDEEHLARIKDQLIIDKNKIRLINVNTGEFNEMLKHPYLDYEVVRNIANFRDQVRPFRRVEELKNIELIDDHLFSKIADYLTVESVDSTPQIKLY